jgi:glutamate carboxypeptidase
VITEESAVLYADFTCSCGRFYGITQKEANMTRLSVTENTLLNQINAAQTAMTDQVMGWSAMNSGSHHAAGLEHMRRALAKRLSTLPGQLHTVSASPAYGVDATGKNVALVHGANIHMIVRPDAPLQCLLAGHMDTVFGQAHPFQTPVWRDGKSINGPGTADMKGGLTVMIAALEALETSPWAQNIGYQIIINADEEVGSLGSAALLEQSAKQTHIGLVFEPAMEDGTLAGARKGIGNYTALVRGKAAHAGRNPQDGRNAIVAISDLMLRLSAIKSDGISINPARIDGGGPTNVVPDVAIGRFEVRIDTHEQRQLAEAKVQELVQTVARYHDVTIDLHGRFHRPPKPMDAIQAGLFAAIKACGSDLDIPIGWRATGGCCDGNNLAATGLPVVDTLGVRGGAIHSADEYMIVDSLAERAQLVALFLMRIASGAMPLPPRGPTGAAL